MNKNTRSIEGWLVREDAENSRVRTLSFSSEEPYDRYFGPEILDHSDGAVDLTRLKNIGVLLFNHDRDKVLGKILKAWIEDARGMAEVEFDTDEDAEKIFSKVQNGTLKTTSVQYRVSVWEDVAAGEMSTDGKHAGPCYIARKWEPLEVSVVSIPADATVGINRSNSTEAGKYAILEKQIQINKNMMGE